MAPASKPRRVLAYARVSSEEQSLGSSLKDQQAAMAAYAKTRGVVSSAVTFYVEAESGIRAKEERREQMRALLADVREGDLVICAKVDRWSRDAEFTYRTVRQILESGASFYAVDDACDPSTPEGDTMLSFRILFAREEHKRIKQRLHGTRQVLRAEGYYVEGLPPYGYRRAFPKGHKGPREKNKLVIDEREASLVRRVFALSIAGLSQARISTETGLRVDRVEAMLRSRIYTGQIDAIAGEWTTSPHIPRIIDADTFFRAQEAAVSRRRGPPPGQRQQRTAKWTLRDVVRCGLCGARMASAICGQMAKRILYYRCGAKCRTGGYVPVLKVEAEAAPMVLARLVELKEELGREPKKEAPMKAPDYDAQRVRLRGKRTRIVDAYGDGDITKEEFKSRVARIDADLARVDAEEAATTAKRSALASKEIRRSVLREVRTLAKAWTAAEPEARREIVKHLASAAKLVKDEPPVFVWRSAEELAEAAG